MHLTRTAPQGNDFIDSSPGTAKTYHHIGGQSATYSDSTYIGCVAAVFLGRPGPLELGFLAGFLTLPPTVPSPAPRPPCLLLSAPLASGAGGDCGGGGGGVGVGAGVREESRLNFCRANNLPASWKVIVWRRPSPASLAWPLCSGGKVGCWVLDKHDETWGSLQAMSSWWYAEKTRGPYPSMSTPCNTVHRNIRISSLLAYRQLDCLRGIVV